MPDNSTAHSKGPKPNVENLSKTFIAEKVTGEPRVSAKKVFPLVLTVLIAGFLILIGSAIQNAVGIKNAYVLISNFISAPKNKIKSENGRTNILIMGKAGGAHDGPDLTDTMMLVSFGFTKNSISVVSIPRDLWVPDIRAKINSAYYWGKTGSAYVDIGTSGGGIGFAEKMAGDIVGQPIQYGVVIDFSAFKDIIDALGGVQVDVANSFSDKLYPIAGRENDNCGGDPTFACRYETVTFDKGLQTMNGDRALIFVRSRHADGVEGTDQAREARQQKVIDAIKNKITDPNVFLSPKVDSAMVGILRKYVETDIDAPAAGVLARILVNDYKSINQHLIPGNLLINPPLSKTYDEQYVFIPKAGNGNWKDIQLWIQTVLP